MPLETLQSYCICAATSWTDMAKERARALKPYLADAVLDHWMLGVAPTLDQLHAFGLDDTKLRAAGLLVSGEHGEHLFFRDRIIAPFVERGEVVYATGRDFNKASEVKDLNLRAEFFPMVAGFNLDVFADLESLRRDGLFVVEGWRDVVALEQLGFHAVAMLRSHIAGNKKLVDLLRAACAAGAPVYFMPDATKDVTRLGAALEAAWIGPSCRYPILPAGTDPDDLKDADAVRAVRDSARSVWDIWTEMVRTCLDTDATMKMLDDLQAPAADWFTREPALAQQWSAAIPDMFENENSVWEWLELPKPALPPVAAPQQPGDEEMMALPSGEVVEEPGDPPDAPVPPEAQHRNQAAIANCRFEAREFPSGEDGKLVKRQVKIQIPLRDILKNIRAITGDWPRRVGRYLFTYDGKAQIDGHAITSGIHDVPDAHALFAYLHDQDAAVVWQNGSDVEQLSLVTKAELYESVVTHATDYDTIEALPHEPPLPRSFYTFQPDETYKPDGSCFRKLLSFFDNPETTADRTLIKAMFCTPCAGLTPGDRPCFTIFSHDRGCGKSTLAEAVGKLYGGWVDLRFGTQLEDERAISRLLQPDNMIRRVVRVDNHKGLLSSQCLESLITTGVISGHRMHKGDTSRPNTLTYIVTGNGLRLSPDMAQRSFFIMLTKPPKRPAWKPTVFGYINQNRRRILMDIIMTLRQPPASNAAYSDRWPLWGEQVLGRICDNPDEIIDHNDGRRQETDEEVEEASLIDETLHEAITERIHLMRGGGGGGRHIRFDVAIQIDEDRRKAFVSAQDLATIMCKALGWRNATSISAGKRLAEHMRLERLAGIARKKTKHHNGYEVDLRQEEVDVLREPPRASNEQSADADRYWDK